MNIGLSRGATGARREVNQDEVGDARRDREAQSRDTLAHPGEPGVVVSHRRGHVRLVRDGRRPGGDADPGEVERPPDAVDRVDHVRRSHHPADPQGRQAVDLREGPGHHDVLGIEHQIEPGAVIVGAHVFGVGPVEDEEDVRRQAGMQAADLL